MAATSKLRSVSRMLGVLALVVAVVRLCMAVLGHTAIPWGAVIAAVAVCALVWMIPEAGAAQAGNGRTPVA